MLVNKPICAKCQGPNFFLASIAPLRRVILPGPLRTCELTGHGAAYRLFVQVVQSMNLSETRTRVGKDREDRHDEEMA